MTNAQVSPGEVDAEADGAANDADTDAASRSATPWSDKSEQQRPRADSTPALTGPPAPASSGNGSETPSSGTAQAAPSTARDRSPGAPPSTDAYVPTYTSPAPDQPTPQEQGESAPPTEAPAEPDSAPQPPPDAGGLPELDPDTIARFAPVALTAGAMALSALPMIASAIAGLAGGGGNSASAPANGGNSGNTAGGLTPEAQQAIAVLKQLEAAYGDSPSDDPEVKALRRELGIKTSGKGSTSSAVKARQRFQHNAATAFVNLDNELATYITGLAGTSKVDNNAVTSLLREVDTALAALGPQAFTQAGQQKVHQILAAALQKAHTIVTGTHDTATDTANAINRLTAQYLYNINGKVAPGSSRTATTAAQKAVSVALAQVGDPYVWGAEGPNSFDCSGLMQYSASAAGGKIPRTAREQYRQLPKVQPADIRPGDLIFPDAQFNGGSPTHVVMYIGNGRCVEAPQPGGRVHVIPLPRGYQATRWS
ncbi:DUF4226 domain-containing protein [Nocardia sp. NPDC006044]|uniref:DUF4226 domain-containing protein n=1 Tax=Nocardia sp. NPDC006044 TaxID=3364306 RepID=UPI00367FFA15